MSFNDLLDGIEAAVKHGAALSIFLGLIIAIGGTQYVKQLDAFPSRRWIIRAFALPLGFVATFATWPYEGYSVRVVMSLAVGVSAPLVYQGITKLLYLKWPQLEPKLSAAPQVKQDPPVSP